MVQLQKGQKAQNSQKRKVNFLDWYLQEATTILGQRSRRGIVSPTATVPAHLELLESHCCYSYLEPLLKLPWRKLLQELAGTPMFLIVWETWGPKLPADVTEHGQLGQLGQIEAGHCCQDCCYCCFAMTHKTYAAAGNMLQEPSAPHHFL